MRARKKITDKVSIERQNNRHKEYVKHIQELAYLYTEDPQKNVRKKENLCKVCYYSKSRIGGSAMTHKECNLCETDMLFCNTCTDELCDKCAERSGLCKHCGADTDYVNKRNRQL